MKRVALYTATLMMASGGAAFAASVKNKTHEKKEVSSEITMKNAAPKRIIKRETNDPAGEEDIQAFPRDEEGKRQYYEKGTRGY